MTPPIVSLLVASSAVTAIIGANPSRIFPDEAIQAATPPYIVWSTTVGSAYILMDAPPPADHVRTTLQIYAMSATERDALYEAARAALEANGYLASLNFSGYDPDTKRYTVSFDWNFILQHGS